MARRKDRALEVPKTEREAALMMAEYVDLDRAALKARLQAQERIDGIKSELAGFLADVGEEQKTRFAALKSWWESGGSAMAGKNRSTEIAGARLGIRLSGRKLKLPKGKSAADMVTDFTRSGWKRAKAFLRIRTSLDKEAVIKALDTRNGPLTASIAKALDDYGFSVEQGDEFFVDTGLDEESVRKELAES